MRGDELNRRRLDVVFGLLLASGLSVGGPLPLGHRKLDCSLTRFEFFDGSGSTVATGASCRVDR
jgi:hypothetical protein